MEYLGGGAGDEKYYVALLGWDRHFAPLPSLYEFVAARGAQKIPAKMSAYEGANLPIDLRSELQRYGYILPPDSVIWIILEVPGSEPIDSVSVHYKIDRKTIDDRIILAPTAASRPIED